MSTRTAMSLGTARSPSGSWDAERRAALEMMPLCCDMCALPILQGRCSVYGSQKFFFLKKYALLYRQYRHCHLNLCVAATRAHDNDLIIQYSVLSVEFLLHVGLLPWIPHGLHMGTTWSQGIIRFRVVYGGRRVGQVLPSYQNRQISALDETADAPQSSLFSLLSSLLSSPLVSSCLFSSIFSCLVLSCLVFSFVLSCLSSSVFSSLSFSVLFLFLTLSYRVMLCVTLCCVVCVVVVVVCVRGCGVAR